jgi:hypothetical protein
LTRRTPRAPTHTTHARSGGQRYALRERIVYIGPAPPPPSPPQAPWYDAPPAPARPTWLGSAAPPGFQEEHLLRLPMQGTSTPLWDSLTFDPFFKLLWIGLDGDGLAFVDTKVSFMQLRWHQSLKANHVTIIPDGMGWVSSVADSAAVLINTWLSAGDEIKRVPLGVGARASAYDGATSTISFVLTNGSVAVLASPSGARRGMVDLRARGARASEHALQSPRSDGAGNLYVAMPYDNKARAITAALCMSACVLCALRAEPCGCLPKSTDCEDQPARDAADAGGDVQHAAVLVPDGHGHRPRQRAPLRRLRGAR